MSRRVIWLWLPVVLYMAGIFYLSAQPSLPQIVKFNFVDKVEHAVAYAGLAIFILRALRGVKPGWSAATVVLAAVIITSAYGISDEIHQIYVPPRSCDPIDWCADTIGAIVGSLITIRFLSRKKKTT